MQDGKQEPGHGLAEVALYLMVQGNQRYLTPLKY